MACGGKVAPKGGDRGVGGQKWASAGGVSGVILLSRGLLWSEIAHCLKYMRNLRRNLSPKVPPKRGHDRQSILEEGRRSARTARMEYLEATCLSELWSGIAPGWESSGTRIGSDPKVYLTGRTYD